MALPPDLDLNGAIFSHASVDARLNAVRMKACKELNYKTSVERGEARGTAREVLGYTIGDVKYEAGATFLSAWWDGYKSDCRAKGFAPMDRPGRFAITVTEPGKASKKIEVIFAGINEADASSASGPEAHEVKVTFAVLVILEDGKPMVARSLYSNGAI